MAGNPFLIDFKPVTNFLSGLQDQRNLETQRADAERHWSSQNAIAQAQLDIQKQNAARQAEEYQRQTALRSRLTEYLSSEAALTGVPKPLRDIAAIQGDASPVQNYIMAEAKRRAEMASREAPSSVREWEYFNRLPQEQKQQYLIMKRAEKYLDTGTGFVRPNPMDPANPTAIVQKDIVGRERAEEIGKAQGKAQADLPRIVDNADQALKVIGQIRSHPGKAYGIGAVGGMMPAVPGTTQAGFVDLVNQARGKAFLEAFNSLRGGGQITEAEGAKATDAIARLNRARRQEDFDAALSDFEEVIRLGVDRARRAAGPAPSPAASGGFSIRRLD